MTGGVRAEALFFLKDHADQTLETLSSAIDDYEGGDGSSVKAILNNNNQLYNQFVDFYAKMGITEK